MSNNQEEITIRRMEKAIQRALDSREKRPDDSNATYFRVGVAATAFVGASALVGDWSMTFPIILFSLALTFGLWEIWVRSHAHSWPKKKTAVVTVLLFILMGAIGFLAYDVFRVDVRVFFINLAEDDRESVHSTSVEMAVKLTNRGKETSLTEWRAYLTMPDGSRINGKLRELAGDNIPIRSANSAVPTNYALPDCDLGVETDHAMPSGDSVYGITEFAFPIPLKNIDIHRTTITLMATDVLGRAIHSSPITIALDSEPHNFPCPKEHLTKGGSLSSP